MTEKLKAFVVVMVLSVAAILFLMWFLKNTPLERILRSRSRYWLAVIAIAFWTPDFFLTMALVGGVCFWAARRDPHPIGVYLMLIFALPPWGHMIHGIGPIDNVLFITHFRVMSIAVLVPLALQMMSARRRGPPDRANPAAKAIDATVITLVVYMLMMHAPHESVTTIMRRSVEFGLDFLLPYFVISRHLRTRESLLDAQGSLLIGGILFTPIAVFEFARSWQLYEAVVSNWEIFRAVAIPMQRDGRLRSGAAAGNPIVLGYIFAICLTMLGAFFSQLKARQIIVLGAALVVGTLVTQSRGPIAGILFAIALAGFLTFKPGRVYLLAIPVFFCIALVLGAFSDQFSPLSFLSLGGSEGAETIAYRFRILETAMLLIGNNPLFGNVLVVNDLEHLRQGQGIIDIVNTYVVYALMYGIIGLLLFLSFLLLGTLAAVKALRHAKRLKSHFFQSAAALALALLSTIFMIATVSSVDSIPYLYISIVGMTVALTRLQLEPAAVRPRQPIGQ